MTELTRYAHPGKFVDELALAQVAYDMSLDGCCETVGSVEYNGFACLLEGPLEVTPEQVEQYGLSVADIEAANRLAGVILFEDSQGFVSCDWYDNQTTLHNQWDKVVCALEPSEEEEELDD